MIETITSLNGTVNGFVWGPFGLALLFAAGLCMTIRNRGFQFAHFAHWMRNTIGAPGRAAMEQVIRAEEEYLTAE